MSDLKNWSLRTSESFNFVVYYKDAAGNPVDLTTGYTVDMDVVDSDEVVIASNVATRSAPANGEITALVEDCSTWPEGTLHYDLILISGSVRKSLLHGNIVVTKGVSTGTGV